jgi:hypothetical protein
MGGGEGGEVVGREEAEAEALEVGGQQPERSTGGGEEELRRRWFRRCSARALVRVVRVVRNATAVMTLLVAERDVLSAERSNPFCGGCGGGSTVAGRDVIRVV